MNQDYTFQYLEDIATAAWQSEVLYCAVEIGLFDLLTVAKTEKELCSTLSFSDDALHRFLQSLNVMGLLTRENHMLKLTEVAATYLVSTSPEYQGHSILWRKHLNESWLELNQTLKIGGRVVFPEDESEKAVKERFYRYSLAMNDIAVCKAREIVLACKELPIGNDILDLGCGFAAISCRFLKEHQKATVTLCDLPEVLELCRKQLDPTLKSRVHFYPVNLLQTWTDLKGKSFSLIIMSNLLHAFDAEDNRRILAQAAACLKEDGVLLIHDFFHDHCPTKAALSDLNMMMNTYNGRVYTFDETEALLKEVGLGQTQRLPLPSDTAILLGKKQKRNDKS